MLPTVKGPTEIYLGNLDRIQADMETIQRQVSSGVRIGQASDDPSAVTPILRIQRQVAIHQQDLRNWNEVKTELEVGDAALQQGSKLLDQALSLASQATSTLVSDSGAMAGIIDQVKGIQQSLVDLSRTASGGRCIFSGDLDQQPLYALDATQKTGVRQLGIPTSTRRIVDEAGSTIWQAPTAADIFDIRNADGTAASGNVFAAIRDLLDHLQTPGSGDATASIDAIKAASDHLNRELGRYGMAQLRIADAVNYTNRSLVFENSTLSELRDTDVAAAAIQLSQITLQQQAALSARGKVSQMSLFDFLA